MIRFECDYGEGTIPEIIEALTKTNLEQTCGYGLDAHCTHAKDLIKKAIGSDKPEIHFLVGGTQANLMMIAYALKPWQGAIAAHTGHINVHETGAIEATGHKVLTVPGKNGKLKACDVDKLCDLHFSQGLPEHTVQPGMVYISQPTEYGTLYSLKELKEISEVCRKYGIFLYVDGARLGYALGSPDNDVTLSDLAELTDAFYIGGTKVGALFGEAMVIMNDALKKDFRYIVKQRGALLAKGRLLGIQFECLFEDDRYLKIGKQAVSLALDVKKAFESKGVRMLIDSPTNQQFPILNKAQQAYLAKKYAFEFWENVDDEFDAVRFCVSWATEPDAVKELIADIQAM